MSSGFCLAPDLFETLFPFHMVIDRDLNITHIGPILHQICPDIIGKNNNFKDHFTIKEPEIITNFDVIRAQENSVFILASHHNRVKLRGQMVKIESDIILFLGSPMIRKETTINRLGLEPSDLLPQDPTKDLLFRLEVQSIALAEARKQAEELATKQIEIHQALIKEQELNELKSRFINTASHEFRTPLGIISSSAGLLEDYDGKLDINKKSKHFKQIQGSVKHMTNLLEDILMINQTDAGKLACKKSQVDLLAFCRGLVEELTTSKDTENRILTIVSCVDPNIDLTAGLTVWIDTKLVRQMLTNLLSNGIKYSFPHSQVEFEIQIEINTVIFRVSDRGIGISKTDQASLFEAFHRGSNVSNIQGTGLGLSIVKRCVDIHGGTITVTSEIGVGTNFIVNLPIAEAVCVPEVSAEIECDKTDINSVHELN